MRAAAVRSSVYVRFNAWHDVLHMPPPGNKMRARVRRKIFCRKHLRFCGACLALFCEGVRRSPRCRPMLFRLWESLKAQGELAPAKSVKRELDAAWAGSDVRLRIEDL